MKHYLIDEQNLEALKRYRENLADLFVQDYYYSEHASDLDTIIDSVQELPFGEFGPVLKGKGREKIVGTTVRSCQDCPHYRQFLDNYDYHREDTVSTPFIHCQINGRKLSTRHLHMPIPKWCPLPDATREEEET